MITVSKLRGSSHMLEVCLLKECTINQNESVDSYFNDMHLGDKFIYLMNTNN